MISLFYVTVLIWVSSISATEYYPSEKQHQRIAFRHIERGGIGYSKGYTTYEGFFSPQPELDSLMPFLDIRGHTFNDGKMAANIGVGLRKVAGRHVYGMNVYYDYRKTHKLRYQQGGFGFEILGERLDFRLNGYMPMGKELTAPYNAQLLGFSGHRIMLLQQYQFAMKGANAELGCHFGKSHGYNFYAAAGPYYFAGKIGPKIWGGKIRLVARYKDYLTFELSNSYDKMFRNRFQGQVTLTIPFGSGACANEPDVLSSRMVQPVERQEIIVIGCSKKRAAAKNPATGNPYTLIFVNNTSHSRGTYESPYPTLAEAQAHSKPGDIIYVYPGDGTTKGMDSGITLQQKQKFWGSGNAHAIATTQGSFTLPAQTATQPRMTNTIIDGNGITLAADNEVSGFTLTQVYNNGIVGTNVQNITITDCTIDSSMQGDQIHLESSGDTSNAVFNNLTLTNGQFKAIAFNSSAASTLCNVNNCTIQNNMLESIDFASTHNATVNFTNNMIMGNENSSNFNFGGTATLTISGNTFKNTSSVSEFPVNIIAGTSPLTATITNNTISDNTCGALRCILNNTNSAQLNINNNSITNNDSGSQGVLGSPLFINPNSTTSGSCSLAVTANTISGNTGFGLYCANGDYNHFQVNASDNILQANTGGGFVFDNSCNTFALNAINNTITQGGDHGIITSGSITLGTASINIDKNIITGNINSAGGVALSHAGTTLTFSATNNTLSNNEGTGILMYAPSVLQNVSVNLAYNTINNNQNLSSNAASGIDIEQFTNLSCALTNNTLSNNTGSSVYIGSTDTAPFACVTMNGNTNDSSYILQNDTGTFNLAPCTVDTVNSGTITRIGTITPVQSCSGAPCS